MNRIEEYARVEHVREMPTSLRHDTIYIGAGGPADMFITFDCPCGCEHLVCVFNREKAGDGKVSWDVVENGGKVTMHPSFQRRSPCNSHFWIRDSKVVWC